MNMFKEQGIHYLLVTYQLSTHYHKFSNFKHTLYYLSEFLWLSNLGTGYLDFLLRDYNLHKRLQSRCWPGLGSHPRLDWGRSCFQAHMVIGRIQILAGSQTEVLSFLLSISQRSPSIPYHVCLSLGQLTHNTVVCFNMAACFFQSQQDSVSLSRDRLSQ